MVDKFKDQISKIKITYQNLKFLIYTLSFCTLIFAFFTNTAFAQSPTPSAIPYTLTPIPSQVSPTSTLYTDLLIHSMFHTVSCLVVGQSVIGQPCLTYQLTKNAQGMIQGVPVLSQVNLSGGALGATTSMIGMLIANPPIRTADYLASLGQGLGIVKQANAQGVVGSGANVLSPIISLWQVSRNIAYVMMIVVFVVIGVMLIFRQKINPQTVITAQAALPGLVIGLILISLSYFLAGLISDTAFLGTNVVGYYFAAAQNKTDDPDRLNLVDKMHNDNVISIFSQFLWVAPRDEITKALASVLDQIHDAEAINWIHTLAGFIAFQTAYQGGQVFRIFPWVGEGLNALVAIGAGATAGVNPQYALGWGLALVAFLALLYSMFRLLLRLINSLITIIYLTITAPFHFLWAALPGRQGVATSWILDMLANVLVFPTVLAVFYFVAFILGQDAGPLKVTSVNQINNSITPAVYAQGKIDIIGSGVFPLFGGINLGFIRILIAFGALVSLPAIPDIVVRTISKASQAGQLIGQELGTGVGQGQKYSGQFQQGLGAVGERASGMHDQAGWVKDATGWHRRYESYTGARPGGISKVLAGPK